jgi:hypothetical protein
MHKKVAAVGKEIYDALTLDGSYEPPVDIFVVDDFLEPWHTKMLSA